MYFETCTFLNSSAVCRMEFDAALSFGFLWTFLRYMFFCSMMKSLMDDFKFVRMILKFQNSIAVCRRDLRIAECAFP